MFKVKSTIDQNPVDWNITAAHWLWHHVIYEQKSDVYQQRLLVDPLRAAFPMNK